MRQSFLNRFRAHLGFPPPWSVRLLFQGFVLTMGALASAQSTQLPPDAFDGAARALVRLIAEGCPSAQEGQVATRISQGFFLGPGEVLTVRHAVAGCQQVTVLVFGGEEHHEEIHRSPAQAVKSLSEADLVLLRLENAPEGMAWPVPLVVTKSPLPDTEIFAIARFKTDISSPQDKRLRVAQGGRRLRNIVDGKARAELESRKSPSLDMQIIKLDGVTITPGTSGAPIIDAAGQVVAIADGGLDGGLTQLTWAIPAEEVERLRSSTETPAGTHEGQVAASLFSTGLASATGVEGEPETQCGDRRFTRIRTVGSGELMLSSDDPLGAQQLLSMSITNSAATRFDIYQDFESGAAFAVPEGGELMEKEGVCFVELGEDIGMILWTKALFSVDDLQLAVESYEGALGATFGQGRTWVPHPDLTYTAPLERDDGLTAMRKTFLSVEPSLLDDGTGQPAIMGALFETLVVRGDTFVGYAVVFEGAEQSMQIQQAMQCLTNEAYGCAALEAQVTSWEQALLAVHLTTFPRN